MFEFIFAVCTWGLVQAPEPKVCGKWWGKVPRVLARYYSCKWLQIDACWLCFHILICCCSSIIVDKHIAAEIAMYQFQMGPDLLLHPYPARWIVCSLCEFCCRLFLLCCCFSRDAQVLVRDGIRFIFLRRVRQWWMMMLSSDAINLCLDRCSSFLFFFVFFKKQYIDCLLHEYFLTKTRLGLMALKKSVVRLNVSQNMNAKSLLPTIIYTRRLHGKKRKKKKE